MKYIIVNNKIYQKNAFCLSRLGKQLSMINKNESLFQQIIICIKLVNILVKNTTTLNQGTSAAKEKLNGSNFNIHIYRCSQLHQTATKVGFLLNTVPQDSQRSC